MKLLTYISIMLCSTLFGQGRLFQPHDDTVFEGHLYKIIRIGSIRREDNGAETIDWKLWFLNDLRPYEKNNLLDMKTQKNMPGVGLFLNANYDSIYFNPPGAQSACPNKWRVPRIGEWDTLFDMLSIYALNRLRTYNKYYKDLPRHLRPDPDMFCNDMKMIMFNELPGYVSYEIVQDDTILKKRVDRLHGGFWWSSSMDENRCEGIELDNSRNKKKGKGSLHDRAAVRCVRDDE